MSHSGNSYGGQVGGYSARVSTSVTRPSNTTQYASGDLIANSETAGSVTALTFSNVTRLPAGTAVIRRALLTKSDDDVTAASFRLHLFSANPVSSTPANGDNGAISLNTAITKYLGSIDFDMTASPDIYNTAGNFAVGIPVQGAEIIVDQATDGGKDVYGLLEARGTYTPASAEVFTAVLEVFQD